MGKKEYEYYKCVAKGWSSFEKGKIYHISFVEEWLQEYPKDFRGVCNYPTTEELLAAIGQGKNVNSVLKKLKTWNTFKK